jgi:hypothetical protein
MSYPPSSEHGCAAADLCHYFLPSTKWVKGNDDKEEDNDDDDDDEEPWYTKDPNGLPPPVAGRSDIMYRSSVQTLDDVFHALVGVIIFGDLSICWFSTEWETSVRGERRAARYRPPPIPWKAGKLHLAQTYSEAVADFALGAVEQGRPINRGE